MVPEKGGDFLQWLRGFYFTAKEGSISKASAIMGRGQPTITQQIKSLESDLDVQLFVRTKKRMVLTEEGQKVLHGAIAIFEDLIALQASVSPNSDELTGQIKIVGTHAVLMNFLPRFVLSFKQKFPKPFFRLDSGSLEYILNSVENADADMGIACIDQAPERMSAEPIFQTRPLLVSSMNKKEFMIKKPTLAKIAKLPFISFQTGSSISTFVRNHFAKKGLHLNVVLELNHFEHVKKYVELGFGVSIMDEYTLHDQDYDRLRIQEVPELEEDSKRIYKLITRQNGYLTPAARAFQELLRKPTGIF
ncbi:MAG: LysR family transcriptional regulator [Deltaproteobacteria bacterium]|nr:LysR family transcriptional regulator [Deltaproteobacteria bacterium]